MQVFPGRFSKTLAQDEHAVMMLDQAGWHGSNGLAVPANITPLPLPSYSSKLNPVERIWCYLQERFLSHACSMITAPSPQPHATPGTT